MLKRFLNDQKEVAFIGAFLLALAGWGNGFERWSEMLSTQAVFGLLAIIGSLLLSNATKSIFPNGGGGGEKK